MKQRPKPKPPLLRLRDPKLYRAALAHPSYRNEAADKEPLEDFDRLEFFGDSILNFTICRKLYALFPEADEGVLSRLRSILVSRKILYRIACELGIPKHLKIGRSLKEQKKFVMPKLAADGFEALLAALYLDQGFEKTERFILRLFKTYFDPKRLFRLDPNPKSTLQEIVQKHWQKLPSYESAVENGKVKTTVAVHRQLYAKAVAANRKASEEKAASLLIRIIHRRFLPRSKRYSSGRKARKAF